MERAEARGGRGPPGSFGNRARPRLGKGKVLQSQKIQRRNFRTAQANGELHWHADRSALRPKPVKRQKPLNCPVKQQLLTPGDLDSRAILRRKIAIMVRKIAILLSKISILLLKFAIPQRKITILCMKITILKSKLAIVSRTTTCVFMTLTSA